MGFLTESEPDNAIKGLNQIIDGKYNVEEKALYTIFGDVKRIRFVATIVDKREILTTPIDSNEDFLEGDDSSNIRIEFDFDDGTGKLRAILWGVNPEKIRREGRGGADYIALPCYQRWDE